MDIDKIMIVGKPTFRSDSFDEFNGTAYFEFAPKYDTFDEIDVEALEREINANIENHITSIALLLWKCGVYQYPRIGSIEISMSIYGYKKSRMLTIRRNADINYADDTLELELFFESVLREYRSELAKLLRDVCVDMIENLSTH